MDDTEEDGDEGEAASWPTLAIPPLYVLRTAESCPECGRAMHVYMLGCAAFRHADDSRPVDVFHFLRCIQSVPDRLMTRLKARCPGFYLDREEGDAGKPYLMNHCQCGARLDDDYLHGDVGAAFWPDTPEGYEQFKLFRLPFRDAIPVVALGSVGGDEFLDFAKAKPW